MRYHGRVLESFLQGAVALLTEVSGTEPAPGAFDPWVELAALAGPVPRRGPLSHDILLARRGTKSFGLNVFAHDPGLPFARVAHSWARDFLGASPDPVLDVPGVRVHGGVAVRASELVLKLYATDGLPELAGRLGVELADAVAIGVDVTRRGLERARTYHPAPPGALPASGSHRLVTLLRGTGAKRTDNVIFRPEAPVADLLALGDPAVDVELVAALTDLARGHGLSLRAVAHETDHFDDGRVETDALVAAGAPG